MIDKEKYYFLSCKNQPKLPSAFYSDDEKLDFELVPELSGKNKMSSDFNLKEVIEESSGISINEKISKKNNKWMDYMSNNLGWPMMSEKMKSLIAQNVSGKEYIDWITCNVNYENEVKQYFILRFNKKLDVLDKKKTTFIPGTDFVIKPCFLSAKVSEYNIFHKPSSDDMWKITSGIYVSEKLKNILLQNDLSGLCFESVNVS